MPTWRELSEQNLEAAYILMHHGYFRISISRSYYAAYCAATHEIVQHVNNFQYGWNNPPHSRVSRYIQNNMPLSQQKKDKISILIDSLRNYRETADYRPNDQIDFDDAINCLRDALSVQTEFWGVRR